ncbi:hypothetical protein D3C87_2099990 [compost metagenome]
MMMNHLMSRDSGLWSDDWIELACDDVSVRYYYFYLRNDYYHHYYHYLHLQSKL